MNKPNTRPAKHIVLTSHPGGSKEKPVPILWGAPSAQARGPIVGTLGDRVRRNVIGTHSGQYALYRALAVAAGSLDPVHVPDLTNTAPAKTKAAPKAKSTKTAAKSAPKKGGAKEKK